MEKTRVGVIGVGHWGPNLLRNLSLNPQCSLQMVAEPNVERVKLLKPKYPEVRFVESARELIMSKDLEAVIIATPTKTHFELAKLALENGKDLFVEKPLTTTVQESEELLQLAKKVNKSIFVGHVFVYNSTIQEVKKILDKGDLGKVFYVHMTRTNLGPVRTDVSSLWDLAPHDISILQYWFSQLPTKVNAVGGNFLGPDLEDCIFATLKYTSGLLAHIHASWLNPQKVREIVLVGEKKMLVWSDMDLSAPIKIYDKSITMEKQGPESELSDTFVSFRASVKEGDTIIPKVKINEPLSNEIDCFLKSLRDPSASFSDGYIGRDVVKVLEAAHRSLKNGGREESI